MVMPRRRGLRRPTPTRPRTRSSVRRAGSVRTPCIYYTCGPARFLLAQSMRKLSVSGFSRLTMSRNFFMLAACTLGMAAGIVCADTSPLPAADYKLARSWKVGGNNGWDYLALEGSGGRLFVTREERVDVIETVSGKLVGSIPHTAGVRGRRVCARAQAWLHQQRAHQHRLGVRTRYPARDSRGAGLRNFSGCNSLRAATESHYYG